MEGSYCGIIANHEHGNMLYIEGDPCCVFSAHTHMNAVHLCLRFIMLHVSSISKKPSVLVLNVSKALIIIALYSEELLVVKYAVEVPMERCITVHATNMSSYSTD